MNYVMISSPYAYIVAKAMRSKRLQCKSNYRNLIIEIAMPDTPHFVFYPQKKQNESTL